MNEQIRRLQTCSGTKHPSAEQLEFIEAVVKRCIAEALDEQRNVEYRSEPAHLLLHGVPGDYTYITKLWHMSWVKMSRSSYPNKWLHMEMHLEIHIFFHSCIHTYIHRYMHTCIQLWRCACSYVCMYV